MKTRYAKCLECLNKGFAGGDLILEEKDAAAGGKIWRGRVRKISVSSLSITIELGWLAEEHEILKTDSGNKRRTYKILSNPTNMSLNRTTGTLASHIKSLRKVFVLKASRWSLFGDSDRITFLSELSERCVLLSRRHEERLGKAALKEHRV